MRSYLKLVAAPLHASVKDNASLNPSMVARKSSIFRLLEKQNNNNNKKNNQTLLDLSIQVLSWETGNFLEMNKPFKDCNIMV